MPPAFFTAVEDTVRKVLHQGLSGGEVTDCHVTLVEAGYNALTSVAADFRQLTSLILMAALRHAGTIVCKPMLGFHLDIPTNSLSSVLPALARHGGVPRSQEVQETDTVVSGLLPASSGQQFLAQLHALTQGEGALSYAFAHYAPVAGLVPVRARRGVTPLDRKAYLQSINKWI